MKTYTLLLFFFLLPLLPFAADGQKVIIQPILIDNNYDEVSANPFRKPENEARFLQALEQKVQQKLGNTDIRYLGKKKIWLVDQSMGKNPQALMADFQEMHRQKLSLKGQQYDVALHIALEIADTWKGKREYFQVRAQVVGTDRHKKKLFRNKAVVHVAVPPVPFALSQLNDKGAVVYEGFPMSEEKLQEALLESVSLALAGEKLPKILAVERKELSDYAAFMAGAQAYRLALPNNYGQYLSQSTLFNIISFARSRPVLLTRLADNQAMRLRFRDRRLTGIGYTAGWSPVYTVAKQHKYFRLTSQSGQGQQEEYILQGVLTDKKALTAITWQDPIRFTLKSRKREPLGEFQFTVGKRGHLSTIPFARSLSRIYHPWAALAGTLAGKDFSISTNPYALNAVEIKVEDQLVGLVVHAAAPKKYLRKNRNQLPYFIYFAPDVDAHEQQLLLQTYQAFHIAHALQNGQDQKVDKI
jgi:hypothetical protein